MTRIPRIAGLAVAATALFSLPCRAADIVGRATVLDGDTLEIHGTRIGLYGVDAPEPGQTCSNGEYIYRCGEEAALALADRISGKTIICYPKGAPVGFITLRQHGSAAWEIHVIAIVPDHHRRGVGRRLLEEGEQWLRSQEAEFLTVKTLSASAEYEPYERTRAFYLAMGFMPLMELPTLWGPENPCLIMIKPLASGQST